MKIYVYSVLFVFLLNECNATEKLTKRNSLRRWASSCSSSGCYLDDEFDVDSFEYKGDPIIFSCYYRRGQPGFDRVKVNGGVPDDLAAKLNNGKGLSIYFHGIGNRVRREGAFFEYVKEWSQLTKKNICIVTYAFQENPTTIFNILSHLNDMISTKRIDFVAKQARDLVWKIRDKCIESGVHGCLRNMSQVDVVGFSFGAHVGSRACKYIYNKTIEKVQLLLGLDPAGTKFFSDKSTHFIQSGDANYVQIIHTSVFGVQRLIGDVNIFLSYKPDSLVSGLFQKHSLGIFMHVATSTKRLYLIAEEVGNEKGNQKPNGTMIVAADRPLRPLRDNEVQIGIYGTFNENQKGKKFRISLKGPNRPKIFWDSIDDYKDGDLTEC